MFLDMLLYHTANLFVATLSFGDNLLCHLNEHFMEKIFRLHEMSAKYFEFFSQKVHLSRPEPYNPLRPTNPGGALTLTTDGDVPLEIEKWTLSESKC